MNAQRLLACGVVAWLAGGISTALAQSIPVITAHPQDQVVLEGSSALFTVTATGKKYGFNDGVSGNDYGDLMSILYGANDPAGTPSVTRSMLQGCPRVRDGIYSFAGAHIKKCGGILVRN